MSRINSNSDGSNPAEPESEVMMDLSGCETEELLEELKRRNFKVFETNKYKMCPNREKCTLKYACKYAEPHTENHECGLGHLSCAILLNTKYTGMYHCSPCINVDAHGRVSK